MDEGSGSPGSAVVGDGTLGDVVAGIEVISRLLGAGAASELEQEAAINAQPTTTERARRMTVQRTGRHVVALRRCGCPPTT